MDRRRRENESGLRPSRKKWAVMRRLGVYLRYASVSSCLLTGVSRGQSAATATIVGKVVDPQGAVILDAKVTAVNTATGVSRSVTTTSSGDYAVPSLPPGTWKRLSLKRLRQMFPARLAIGRKTRRQHSKPGTDWSRFHQQSRQSLQRRWGK